MSELKLDSTKLIKFLIASVITLLLIHIVLQYAYHIHGIEILSTIRGRFDVDNEISIPTWFSQVLLLVPAALSFLLYATVRNNTDNSRFYWALLGCLFIFLSVDEGAMLHEAFITKFREWTVSPETTGIGQHTWLIPVAILLIILSVPFIKLLRSLPRKTALILTSGLALYVFGAIVYETLGLVLVSGEFAYQGLNVAFEEGLEMLGVIVIIHAILSHIKLKVDTFKVRIS